MSITIRCLAAALVLFFLNFRDLNAQTHSSTLISGYVFDDSNNNGLKDSNEKGVKGVTVSDQVTVVTTNEDGFYQINYTSPYGILFISAPEGFQVTKNFWQRVDTINHTINFALKKISVSNSFTFIQASDTHVSESSLDRMQRFRQIVDSVKPDLVIITGDLVRDALRVGASSPSDLCWRHRGHAPATFVQKPIQPRKGTKSTKGISCSRFLIMCLLCLFVAKN